MSAHVALALLALGTPAARLRMRTPHVGTESYRRLGGAQPQPHVRDVTTAIAALAAQFRETSLASRKPR